jgi:CheY-like chemotaxis protein
MTDKPSFIVAVAGLDAQQVRLIEIVFRHIQYNRFVFRLADGVTFDRCDILIAGLGDSEGRAALERMRTERPGVATIAVIGDAAQADTRHAIRIGELTRQLLPILNRVVEIERLVTCGRIPARRRDVANASPPVPAHVTVPLLPELRPRPRVLLIDDCAVVRSALCGHFDRMGLSVESVCTGDEAMARLAATQVDLAMLDIVLPDTNGLQLARRIRREERWRDLPIVVLSSRSSTLDVIRGAAAGCSAYLAKPVDFGDLQRTVARQLSRVLHADAMPPQLRLVGQGSR